MAFLVSHLLQVLADPGTLFLLLLFIGLCMLRRRAARRLLCLTFAAMVLVSALPLGAWLLAPLENRFPVLSAPTTPVAGIVVLGGSTSQALTAARAQPQLGGNAERLIEFVHLARLHPSARLIFAGGSGRLLAEPLRESDVARMVFAELGVDPARVEYDSESRSTFENARNALALARPKPGETWLLVTSAAHMPRAMLTFQKAGFPMTAFPVDFQTAPGVTEVHFSLGGGLIGLVAGAKEWAGLIYYRILGYTDRLWP